jgi:hypothetical protein
VREKEVVADTGKPPVVVPVVVVAVDVEVPLIAIPIERSDCAKSRLDHCSRIILQAVSYSASQMPKLFTPSIFFFEGYIHHSIPNRNQEYSQCMDTGLGGVQP